MHATRLSWNYTDLSTPLLSNYIFSALAGTTWFLQFFFMEWEKALGNGPSSWILHMAFIILVANSWGTSPQRVERSKKKTITSIITGILVIVLSVLIVGYGNYLKE